MTSEIIKKIVKYVLPLLGIIYLFKKGWPLNDSNPFSLMFTLIIFIILITIAIILLIHIVKFIIELFDGDYDNYINNKFDPVLKRLFNIFKNR